MRLRIALYGLAFCGLGSLAAPAAAAEARALREQADGQRRGGDCQAALATYGRARQAGDDSAELWMGIGACQERLGHYRDAESAYRRAVAGAPANREAQDDLQGLRLRRGLRLRANLGGTEPDSSRTGFEAAASYGGLDRLDLHAVYAYVDQVFYTSHKVGAAAYWFYQGESYLKVEPAWKIYDYPTDPAVQKPNPDSNSYKQLPRIDLEATHWFGTRFRGGLAYQFFAPTFFYDPATRAYNHKLSAEARWLPAEPVRLDLVFAALRDPDPNRTLIQGRPEPGNPTVLAPATSVTYRTTWLVGGAVGVQGPGWNAEARYLPNRDLDNSYQWSALLSGAVDLAEPVRLLAWYIHDVYSKSSTYSGKTANIVMGEVRWQIVRELSVGAGGKYVDAPTRRGPTLLLSAEWRTGLL